nr:MAG: hypothetical protein 1 [Leviviridae sp.]
MTVQSTRSRSRGMGRSYDVRYSGGGSPISGTVYGIMNISGCFLYVNNQSVGFRPAAECPVPQDYAPETPRFRYDPDEVRSIVEELWDEYSSRDSVPVEEHHFVTSEEIEFMNDVSTPDFYARSAKGEIINSPMDHDKIASTLVSKGLTVRPEGMSLTYSHTNNLGNNSSPYSSQIRCFVYYKDLDGQQAGELAYGLTNLGYAQLLALTECPPSLELQQSAIDGARSAVQSADLDLLVVAAELPKTVRYIHERLMSVYKILRSLKKGTWRKYARKAWRRRVRDRKNGKYYALYHYLSDIWLEMRYAIRPLVFDIQGAIKVLESTHSLSPRQTFRSFRSDSSSEDIDVGWVEGEYTYRFVGSKEVDHFVRGGALCHARLENGLPKELGLFNITSAAWDLVPYSFVVDWFIDVSGLLAALNPNPIFEELSAWVVDQRDIRLFGSVEVTHSSGSTESLPIAVNRTLTDRIPNPSTNFIQIDVDLDIFRGLDLIALIKSVRLK